MKIKKNIFTFKIAVMLLLVFCQISCGNTQNEKSINQLVNEASMLSNKSISDTQKQKAQEAFDRLYKIEDEEIANFVCINYQKETNRSKKLVMLSILSKNSNLHGNDRLMQLLVNITKNEKDVGVRASAILVLGGIHTVDSYKELSQILLSTNDKYEQYVSIIAIGNHRNSKSDQILERFITDSNPKIAEAAQYSLDKSINKNFIRKSIDYPKSLLDKQKNIDFTLQLHSQVKDRIEEIESKQ